MAGAVEVVSLAARHFTTALASGSPRSLIDTITGSPKLKGKFDLILSGDQFTNCKPAPDIYFGATEKLNLEPNQCVCLEDSGSGILSGNRAGMKVIAVPDPQFPPDSETLTIADEILESLNNLELEHLRQGR